MVIPDSLQELIHVLISFNPYYLVPVFLVVIVVFSQWKYRENKNLPLLTTHSLIVFSTAVSIQYMLIFLVTGSLHEPLNWPDRLITGAALIFVFLIVMHHETEGTPLGNRISDVLDKYFLSGAIPVPVSSIDEQLDKLQKARETLGQSDKNLESARHDILQNTVSAMTLLKASKSVDDEIMKDIQSAFDHCKTCLQNLSNGPKSDEEKREAEDSLSELIGTLEGAAKGI